MKAITPEASVSVEAPDTAQRDRDMEDLIDSLASSTGITKETTSQHDESNPNAGHGATEDDR